MAAGEAGRMEAASWCSAGGWRRQEAMQCRGVVWGDCGSFGMRRAWENTLG